MTRVSSILLGPRRLRVAMSLGFAAFVLATTPVAAASDDIDLCNRASEQPDAAIAACTRLLEGKRSDIIVDAIYNNRGVGWSRKGIIDSAIDDYTAAIQQNPKNTSAFLNRGVAWTRKSEFNRAISDFNQVINLDRKAAVAYAFRGVALMNTGEFERAISDFNQSIQLDGNYQLAFKQRALAYYHRRQFDRAIADFNQAVKLAPNDATTYNDRAQVWIDRGEYDRAISDYNQSIRLDPQNWRGYSSRAEAKRRKGDLNGALADHGEAIRLDSNAHDAYNNRALVWKDRGDLDKAIADLNEAILLKPADGRALGNRGEIRRLLNDLEGSRADLDNAIKLFPKSAVLHCRRGDTLTAIGLLDRALADYNEALVISPNALCAYAGRGLLLEKQGDLAAARSNFERATKLPVEKDPDLVTAKQAQAIATKQIAAIDAALASRKRDTDTDERQRSAEAEKLRRQVEELQRQAAARQGGPAQAAEAPVDPGHRVALVIGNSAYAHAGVLPNPRRDAEAVAKAFREIGFQRVIVEHDLTRAKLLATLGNFEAAVTKADWGVIYYAGHGMELGGVNYVIPVDAKLDTDRDVQDQAIPLERVMASLDHAKKLRLVVLDACRDNPFLPKMRRIMVSATRDPIRPGLASIEPERGTLVAYAAKHGQVAADGTEGKHSPFVSAFLARLQEPRLEINMLFRHVRDDVLKATSHRQEPHIYGTLPAQTYYFKVK